MNAGIVTVGLDGKGKLGNRARRLRVGHTRKWITNYTAVQKALLVAVSGKYNKGVY